MTYRTNVDFKVKIVGRFEVITYNSNSFFYILLIFDNTDGPRYPRTFYLRSRLFTKHWSKTANS
jgi:hypothetical protein